MGYLKFREEASRIMQFWLWAIISALAAFIFYFLIRDFGNMPEGFHIGVPEIVIGLIVVIATLVIHELIHALVMIRYGARPKFEMAHNNLVATLTAPGYGFRRNSVILVSLTPLIALTCLALLGIWLFQGTYWVALFASIAVINAGSSFSDFWLVGILLKYPSNVWTVDEKEGMQILLPVEENMMKKKDNPFVGGFMFSQLDYTDGFSDNLRLKPDQWIETIPLNASIPNPKSQGLPEVGEGDDQVYLIASKLSLVRESIDLPDDGVYCPVCHIANVDLAKLRTACPKCGRQLLQFGWD